jgi:septal ring factor EnvC (AmiA/AmiB activator)
VDAGVDDDLGPMTPSQEKKGPSVNEQLRKLREDVAREYEEKYRGSLEEVDKYKEQLEQGLRDAEKRQAAIAQRQIQDKDKVITQLHGQKTSLENEISHLE